MIWHDATKELPADGVEVLVRVARPFSNYAVAMFDRDCSQWLQYLPSMGVTFAGGWVAFYENDKITHWAEIEETTNKN